MLTLRLTQRSEPDGAFQVEAALESEGSARQTAISRFSFEVSADDQRDIHWYLESYLDYPVAPLPARAARVEQRIADVGKALFSAIFTDDARDLWAWVRPRLNEARIEIVADVQGAAAIFWELMRDPRTVTAHVRPPVAEVAE
jgi:hypothetical protein